MAGWTCISWLHWQFSFNGCPWRLSSDDFDWYSGFKWQNNPHRPPHTPKQAAYSTYVKCLITNCIGSSAIAGWVSTGTQRRLRSPPPHKKPVHVDNCECIWEKNIFNSQSNDMNESVELAIAMLKEFSVYYTNSLEVTSHQLIANLLFIPLIWIFSLELLELEMIVTGGRRRSHTHTVRSKINILFSFFY